MLLQLNIRNYVIIEELIFKPEKHLNIITGETGAGKSIVLGALGLVMGERADAGALLDKNSKCVVEAHFDVSKHSVFRQALKEAELDEEDVCIIRREIAANGKSRAFINDTPVTVNMLNKLSSLLVDLHQQFGHLALKEDSFQMDVVDALAGNQSLKTQYQQQFQEYRKLTQQLEALKAAQLQIQKEADYKTFLLEELEQAAFTETEIEDVESQLKQMAHAERILSVLQSSRMVLNEGEHPIVNELKKIAQQLQSISEVLPDAAVLQQRILSVYEELKDVANELENTESKISLDAEKMNQLQERVDWGYKLLKKHGLQRTEELVALQKALSEELKTAAHLHEDIKKTEAAQAQLFLQLKQQAAVISSNRKKIIPDFERHLNALLTLVGMPNAKLKIDQSTEETPTIHGIDTIVFLFDANKTNSFSPVYKAASGGEMSRIMLCIKSLTAKAMQLPTLLFDEVDTGISGEAAKQVGVLLKALAQYHQVLCITHQPQVAAKADAHFYVYKNETHDRITAKMKLLNAEEHVFSIAQMIGGENPGEAAINNAKELTTE